MSSNTPDPMKLDTIVQYAKRKGYVFASSEIYGGFAATYDYGPLGALLKQNLVQAWRDFMVAQRVDTVEIEGAIFLHPKVWEASGHIGNFSDLLVEDMETRKRYRADHLIEDAGIMDNAGALTAAEVDQVIVEHKLTSPEGNLLGKAKSFNLMVKTHLGPVEDEASAVYLKGEACQNIYVDWKLVQETTRKKLPFGIAQLGKAFRNEITVKQFLFRTREFEQIDMQFFVKPGEEDQWYEYWKQQRMDFFTTVLGYQSTSLRWRQHTADELVFYAKDAWDIEYRYGELGFKEMEGVHNRTDYDTSQHQKFSGQDLTYFDAATNERYLPYIVEMSLGVNRMFLSALYEFYAEELLEKDETRIVMRWPINVAPYKVAILPLMKKDGLKEKAEELHSALRKAGIMTDYDEAGSIGKRYRRQDESGTPLCVTIDYDTLQDGTVTIRHRDTMEQTRITIGDIQTWVNDFK
jgi:glycyl-tRNA synthetase